MANRRRWFQFSLRGFMVMLTIGCLWLGWRVERAHKRARAIDAIVRAGGDVVYDGYLRIGEEVGINHFYLDLKGVPVDVGVREPLNASVGMHLSRIDAIRSLHIESYVSDTEVQHLDHVDDVREITLFRAESVTDTAIEDFRRKHSHVVVGLIKAGRVVWIGPFAEGNN